MAGTLQLVPNTGTGAAGQDAPLALALDGVLDLQRYIQWQYNGTASQFATQVNINASWLVAACSKETASSTTAADGESNGTLLTVTGPLQLVSTGYPGPGLTGQYQWAGQLRVSPNPWAMLAPAANRRLQQAGATGLGGGPQVEQSSHNRQQQQQQEEEEEEGDTALLQDQQPQCRPQQQQQQQQEEEEGVAESQASLECSVDEGLGGSRQLLASDSQDTVTVTVAGDVRVTEVTPVAVPSTAQDMLRGDDLHLLDADGSVVIVGAAVLPDSGAAAMPEWKRVGVTPVPESVTPGPGGYTGPALAGIAVGAVAAAVVVVGLAVGGWRLIWRQTASASAGTAGTAAGGEAPAIAGAPVGVVGGEGGVLTGVDSSKGGQGPRTAAAVRS
jgi:hypothetical protein